MTEEEKKQLFLQMDRDVGTLISMLSDCKMSSSDRDIVIRIANRMDEASPKLQEILYPESLTMSQRGSTDGGAGS